MSFNVITLGAPASRSKYYYKLLNVKNYAGYIVLYSIAHNFG
jgi:hypothetical protein